MLSQRGDSKACLGLGGLEMGVWGASLPPVLLFCHPKSVSHPEKDCWRNGASHLPVLSSFTLMCRLRCHFPVWREPFGALHRRLCVFAILNNGASLANVTLSLPICDSRSLLNRLNIYGPIRNLEGTPWFLCFPFVETASLGLCSGMPIKKAGER